MAGYTKLFSSIVGSTVWRERNHVRIVWVTLLALADRRGIVEASVPGLADFARVTRKQCDEALERLQAPDPDSRSPADEGRRIRSVSGGWQLVNFASYREKMNADERREYKRLNEQARRKQRRVDTSMDSRGQTWTNMDAVDTVPAPEATPEAEERKPLPAKDPPDPRVKAFLDWFQTEYKARRHGAEYFVQWRKDAPTVKRLLKVYSPERLQRHAKILLITDDNWIDRTDRGIGILATKINWLEERLATWEATHPVKVSAMK